MVKGQTYHDIGNSIMSHNCYIHNKWPTYCYTLDDNLEQPMDYELALFTP